MLKIGEFSKLSHLTIKALRFYEKEGLLIPQKVDLKKQVIVFIRQVN